MGLTRIWLCALCALRQRQQFLAKKILANKFLTGRVVQPRHCPLSLVFIPFFGVDLTIHRVRAPSFLSPRSALY